MYLLHFKESSSEAKLKSLGSLPPSLTSNTWLLTSEASFGCSTTRNPHASRAESLGAFDMTSLHAALQLAAGG